MNRGEALELVAALSKIVTQRSKIIYVLSGVALGSDSLDSLSELEVNELLHLLYCAGPASDEGAFWRGVKFLEEVVAYNEK